MAPFLLLILVVRRRNGFSENGGLSLTIARIYKYYKINLSLFSIQQMQGIENQRNLIQESSFGGDSSIYGAGTLFQMCSICLWQFSPQQLYSVDNCMHVFCLNCLTSHIQQSIGNLKYPKCPEQGCEVKLSATSQLYKALSVALKNRILNIDNYRKGLTDANIKPCQKADCAGVFDISKKSICQICASVHCKTCNQLNHQGQCQMKVAISLEMTNKFRQCSVCGLVIEKTEGCTHMQCTCGNYFCYSCGETLAGEHECKPPSHLNCLQSVRWELQHLELWYQKFGCSWLRVILCFSPPQNLSYPVTLLWITIFCLLFYPLLILLTIGMIGLATVIILASALLFMLMIPFLGLCANNLALFPTHSILNNYGCCAAFACVVLLYPVLLVINLIQVVYQLATQQGIMLHEVLVPFSEMLQGLKYVLLSPCLMLVNNQKYYVQNAQLRDPKNAQNAQLYKDEYI